MKKLFEAAPTESILVKRLKESNRFIDQNQEGEVRFFCPFSDIQHEAVYELPTSEAPYGHFKCRICSSLGTQELASRLKLDHYELRMKPRIMPRQGLLHERVAVTEKILGSLGYVFDFFGTLVQCCDDNEHVTVKPLSQTDLELLLSECCVWLKQDARSTPPRCQEIDPPVKIVQAILKSSSHPNLRRIKAVSSHPLISDEGRLLLSPGFSETSGILLKFNEDNYKKYAFETVTRFDALSALNELKLFFSSFTFERSSDLTAAIAAALTAVLRPALDSAPAFAALATDAASGKSTLCDILGYLAAETIPASIDLPDNKDEVRKTILAELINWPTTVYFDNVQKTIPDQASICTVLTQERIEGRILGTSDVASAPTRVLMLFSGNFLHVDGDMRRRIVPIFLQKRTVSETTDIKAMTVSECYRLQMAALKIVGAFLQAGCPEVHCLNFVGFRRWELLVRRSLLWLENIDPLERVFELLKQEDPNKLLRRELLEKLWLVFENRIFAVKNITPLINENRYALKDTAVALEIMSGDRANSRKLGWVLSGIVGHRIDEYILRKVGEKTEYRIDKVK